jgi:protein tyrosine phosphatase (PTP) superfamily phosphohydrolase (DUF442 family)
VPGHISNSGEIQPPRSKTESSAPDQSGSSDVERAQRLQPLPKGGKEESVSPPPKPPEETKKTLEGPDGIPQFAKVQDKPSLVSSGLKPFADGLDWLRDQGYNTVLFIRPPGADDSLDRDRIVQRGLKYKTLELSADILSAARVEEFEQILAESANKPLYIYDDDGTVAGGLFYLHFLKVDKTPEAKAREAAGRLGLPDSSTGNAGTMWIAIQKYLGK